MGSQVVPSSIFTGQTGGRSLEDMDVLFGTITAERHAKDVEYALEDPKGTTFQLEDTHVKQ
jgi:hypothetical protein